MQVIFDGKEVIVGFEVICIKLLRLRGPTIFWMLVRVCVMQLVSPLQKFIFSVSAKPRRMERTIHTA